MALRVTQLQTEVAGDLSSTAKLRVTQVQVDAASSAAETAKLRLVNFGIQVIGVVAGTGSYLVDASNALDLAQVGRAGTIYANADSSIVVAGIAGVAGPRYVDASNSLSIIQTASSGLHKPVASSTLALTQAGRSSIVYVSASSSFTPSQSVVPGLYTQSLISPLSLTSTARSSTLDKALTSTLTMSSVASAIATRVGLLSAISLTSVASAPQIRRKAATSTLAVTQAAVGLGPFYRNASNLLEFQQTTTSGLVFADASNMLSLLSSGRKAETYTLPTTSAVTASQTAMCTNMHAYASSVIVVSSQVDTPIKPRSIESELSLSDTATAERVLVVSSILALGQSAESGSTYPHAESVLALSQVARNGNLVRSVTSTIALDQTVDTSIKMLAVESNISLSDSVRVLRPIPVSAENEITELSSDDFDIDSWEVVEVTTGLTQSVEVLRLGARLASNIISFATVANAAHAKATATPVEAENTLTLTAVGRISKTLRNEPLRINLTQVATAQVGKSTETNLDSLGVTADCIVLRGVSAGTTLVVTHAVAFVFEQSTTPYMYSPFVGEGSDPNAPTPPTATYQAAGATSGFRLQFPASGSVTDELILRAPNLGNRDRLTTQRINRETRGGTFRVFSDLMWPKVETLALSFSGLTNVEVQALLAFMENHVGQEIKLIDWEDRTWVGVLTNIQDPAVQDRRGNCNFTASFEFEGQKV